MKHLTLVDHNIDWKQLREQKLTLINTIDDKKYSACEITRAEGERLNGILHLIDFIQDNAVDNNSFDSMQVFNLCETIECTIRFNGSRDDEIMAIGICDSKYFENDNVPLNDDDIFYYVHSVNNLYRLLDPNHTDFVIVPEPKEYCTIQGMIHHEEVGWQCSGHPVTYDTMEEALEDANDVIEGDDPDYVGYCRKLSENVYFIYDIDENYLFTHNVKEHI